MEGIFSERNVRMSKYNSKKTIIDGIVFDSKKEAKRYQQLKKLEDEGVIENLRLQVPFEIQESFVVVDYEGKKHKRRPIRYIADFVYTINSIEVVEDVKGRKTDVYALKKKMFEAKFNKTIKET